MLQNKTQVCGRSDLCVPITIYAQGLFCVCSPALLGCLDTSLNQVSIASGGKKQIPVLLLVLCELCNTEYTMKATCLNLGAVFLMSSNFGKGLSFWCLLMCLLVVFSSHCS